MKIGYLILAHSDLKQVKRLISTLTTKNSRFYIHVDEKCTEKLPNNTHGVKWLSSHDIAWGSFTMISATLKLLALSSHDKNQWHILLSGTHYPIKKNTSIIRHLKEQETNAIIESNTVRLEEHPTINHALRDFNFHPNTSAKYVIHVPPFFSNRFLTLENLRQVLLWLKHSRRIPRRFFTIRRHFKNTRKGCQWWCIDDTSAQYILKKDIKSEWDFTHVPDEICIQTILGNSDLAINNSSLTYTRWSNNNGSPDIIDDISSIEDVITSSNFLFARKFKPNSPILDEIDKRLYNSTS